MEGGTDSESVCKYKYLCCVLSIVGWLDLEALSGQERGTTSEEKGVRKSESTKTMRKMFQ